MTALPLTLLGAGTPAVRARWPNVRTTLDPCCWIDHCSDFIEGADSLLVDLEASVSWERGRRLMYGTWHHEPRRTGSTAECGFVLPKVVDEIRQTLSDYYDRRFEGLFCNFYETGSDSVAWHADRIGRTEVDPLVAIISLGGPRTFAMRPRGGGESHRLRLASGDLLVMGGATQHHWEHSVPKTSFSYPRMSVTMRAGGPPLSLIDPGVAPSG